MEKKSKDEHVQLGMNKNRTEGGQSKENPGEKPSALSREIDVLTVSAQSKTKDKNIYGSHQSLTQKALPREVKGRTLSAPATPSH